MKKTIAIVGVVLILLAGVVFADLVLSNEGSVVFKAVEKPLEAQTYIYVGENGVDCSEDTSLYQLLTDEILIDNLFVDETYRLCVYIDSTKDVRTTYSVGSVNNAVEYLSQPRNDNPNIVEGLNFRYWTFRVNEEAMTDANAEMTFEVYYYED